MSDAVALSALQCAGCPQVIDTANRPELTDAEQNTWLTSCEHVICKFCVGLVIQWTESCRRLRAASLRTETRPSPVLCKCGRRIEMDGLLRIHLHGTHPPPSPGLSHIQHLADLQQEKKNKLHIEGAELFRRVELLQARRDAAKAKLDAACK
ncbi:hypothetical protein FRC09_014813 [Ceratobasidium sp. 395]|nr:hypothetical protein FRC09_014813 [Ceratobasidium sp. 395]